jgi:hypothetical protein
MFSSPVRQQKKRGTLLRLVHGTTRSNAKRYEISFFHPMPRGIEWGSKGIESPLRGAGKIWDPEEIGPVIHELIPALIAGTAGYLHPF